MSLLACQVDQQAEVAQYQKVLAIQAASADTQPSQPQDTLSLSHSLTLANQHNQQLAIEGERFVQAIIDKQRAVARFLPTLAFAPSYKREDLFATWPGNASIPVRDSTELPLQAQWNLFNGFQDSARLAQSAASIDQRRALLLDAQANLLLNVAETFYGILQAERSVQVLQASLALQEERVRDMQARKETGFARPLDVSQTISLAAGTRAQLIQARQQVRRGRDLLTLLIGVEVSERPLRDDLLAPAQLPDLDQWQQTGRQRREDLRAADYALEAAQHRVQEAIGQYYPSLTLNLQYAFTADSLVSEHGWNAVLQANLPIFTAGQIHADVRTAWSQVRQAKLQQIFTQRQIHQQISTAHENWMSGSQRLAELTIQHQAALEAFNQAEGSFNVGLATNLERLTAQQEWLAAQLQLAAQQYGHQAEYLTLLRAAGLLSPSLSSLPPILPDASDASASSTQPSR